MPIGGNDMHGGVRTAEARHDSADPHGFGVSRLSKDTPYVDRIGQEPRRPNPEAQNPKTLHESTFEYLKPTDEQLEKMQIIRTAAKLYAAVLDQFLPQGPDKTFILRAHRSNAMWANVALTRHADGTPR